MPERTIDILVVDDDDLTAELVERALQELPARFNILRAFDGQQGLEVLSRIAARPRRRLLILLDINMPRMDGFEFIAALRAAPMLCDHVVFFLTTSDDERDVLRAWRSHPAGYLTKPTSARNYAPLAEMIGDYCAHIRLPV